MCGHFKNFNGMAVCHFISSRGKRNINPSPVKSKMCDA